MSKAIRRSAPAAKANGRTRKTPRPNLRVHPGARFVRACAVGAAFLLLGCRSAPKGPEIVIELPSCAVTRETQVDSDDIVVIRQPMFLLTSANMDVLTTRLGDLPPGGRLKVQVCFLGRSRAIYLSTRGLFSVEQGSLTLLAPDGSFTFLPEGIIRSVTPNDPSGKLLSGGASFSVSVGDSGAGAWPTSSKLLPESQQIGRKKRDSYAESEYRRLSLPLEKGVLFWKTSFVVHLSDDFEGDPGEWAMFHAL